MELKNFKRRILVELYKILNLKNFINSNQNTYLKEIFNLIFPELANIERLDRLKKVFVTRNKFKTILAVY